jgi:hypothetical protein
MGQSAQIIRMPIEKRMPTRIAEDKIGGLAKYRYPVRRGKIPSYDWLSEWLTGKSVLFGWTPINDGLVAAFKRGYVRHFISRVGIVDIGKDERPRVELCCGCELHPIFNWSVGKRMTSSVYPVSLLGLDQVRYFRVCRRCATSSEGSGYVEPGY